MLRNLIIASAALVAATAPGLAASSHMASAGSWVVLKPAGGTDCYVADRAAGPAETQLGGHYATEQQATQELGKIALCDTVNTRTD